MSVILNLKMTNIFIFKSQSQYCIIFIFCPPPPKKKTIVEIFLPLGNIDQMLKIISLLKILSFDFYTGLAEEDGDCFVRLINFQQVLINGMDFFFLYIYCLLGYQLRFDLFIYHIVNKTLFNRHKEYTHLLVPLESAFLKHSEVI